MGTRAPHRECGGARSSGPMAREPRPTEAQVLQAAEESQPWRTPAPLKSRRGRHRRRAGRWRRSRAAGSDRRSMPGSARQCRRHRRRTDQCIEIRSVQRLDLYSAVHKMQRARPCRLIVETGAVDPSDALSATRLTAAVQGPRRRAAGPRRARRSVHSFASAPARAPLPRNWVRPTRSSTSNLSRCVRSPGLWAPQPWSPTRCIVAWPALPPRTSTDVAREEEAALLALWDACSDAELAGTATAFKGSRSDTENLTSLLARRAPLGLRFIDERE
jgi:hypothetical protein